MRYQGGKSRISRPIVETIRRMHPTATEIWEPFCGGGAVTLALSKVNFKVHASDIHPDLILMWQAVMAGDESVYANVTREEHSELKHATPSARRGFVRFGASFGGDFYGGFGVDRKNGDGHQPWQEAQRFCEKVKRAACLSFSCMDYKDVPSSALCYADPPYQNTYKYQGNAFDHTSFWQWVRERKGPTFVSELVGPDDMQIVWRKAHKSQMTSNSPTSRATSGIVHREERVYYWPGSRQ